MSKFNLKIEHKIWMNAAIVAAIILSLISFFAFISNKDIKFTRQEILGQNVLAKLMTLVDDISEYSIYVSLSENEASKDIENKAIAKEQDVEKSIKDILGINQADILALQLDSAGLKNAGFANSSIDNLMSGWQELQNKRNDPAKFIIEANSYRDKILGLITQVGNISNLILDPEMDSYYAVDILLTRVPTAVTRIASMVELLAPSVILKNHTNLDKTSIAISNDWFINNDLSNIAGDIDIIVKANKTNPHGEVSKLDEILNAEKSKISSSMQSFIDFINNKIIAEDKNSTVIDLLNTSLTAKNDLMDSYNISNKQLTSMFEHRLNDLESYRTKVILCALLTFIISNIFYYLFVVKSIRSFEKLSEIMPKISSTDIEIVIPFKDTNNELGNIARDLQNFRDQIMNMNEAVKVLQDVSKGNLNNKMCHEYKGTFADIKEAINTTVDQLKAIVLDIKISSDTVATAATEISTGSIDLSQRTESQASALEETSASMEELTATVKQNSNNTQQATKISVNARELAQKGGNIVDKAVIAMSEIEKSSKKVSDIISVIDEIAFQTNLLALNAAVEAARAGDAGKGFAVVASEVRSLAGRSAASSKEIKLLIEESSNQVKVGADLVNEAGMSLKEIVEANNDVNKIISEIAEATKEQTSSIEEINSAISQMDRMTQQNAALVEENTAASQSLVDQAKHLDQLISFFVVDDGNSDDKSHREVSSHISQSPNKKSSPAKTNIKHTTIKDKNLAVQNYDKDWEKF